MIKIVSISIIVCTYNPDKRLLFRCLEAILALDNEGIDIEIILVDNNSNPKLTSIDFVESFLNRESNARCIVETKQGLSAARLAGIKAAKGEWVVFFDDDNEPVCDYLQSLTKIIKEYPSVGAWGPGNVSVDFIDGISDQIKEYAESVFQRRSETIVKFANNRSLQPFYPYGTGLCIERTHLLSYVDLVENGQYTLTDRKGNEMSSGGDTQIVLNCIAAGAAAGVAPGLKLTHIIPKERTTLTYLKRLIYGMNISYHLSVLQVFPEYEENLFKEFDNGLAIKAGAGLKYLKATIINAPVRTLKTIRYLSLIAGGYFALGKPVPKLIERLLKKV